MAEMGRPLSMQESKFRNVGMMPKDNANDKIAQGEKERLLSKITGFREKSIYDNKPKDKIGKDEFLKLLTHQLNNQDPMNPMEQNKFAAELAQFSQLEQLTNLNSKFDVMTKTDPAKDKFYAASFLGKEVVTSGSSLNFKGEGTQADVLFTLEKPSDKILVRVLDNNNNIVSEIWKENIGRGNQTFTWDGYALDGAPAKAGEYKVNISAWDQNSDPVIVDTKTTGIVESVFFENEEAVLLVGGKKVFLRDVDSFHMPKAINAAQNMPIAQSNQNNIELNKPVVNNTQQGLKSYQSQMPAPTTGLTNVYDE
jgi:flagellar basal-body rod modification protein FlgD